MLHRTSFDKLDYASFVANLLRREPDTPRATPPGGDVSSFATEGLSLFVSQGTIDLSRRLDDAERR